MTDGRTTAIYYAGSTQQNGPHMALGKHNFIAHTSHGVLLDNLGLHWFTQFYPSRRPAMIAKRVVT